MGSDASSSDSAQPGAGGALLLLLLINLFNYMDRYMLAAVLPRVGQTFFPHDANAHGKLGSLSTAFVVSYMIASPIFGFLADRTSRWVLVGISVLLWSLASGASGLAPTFMALMVTRMFVGVGEAGYGPAAPTLISDFYPQSKRGFSLALFYMAIPVGSALGFVWGGKISSIFEHSKGLDSWRWAFYCVVPPGLLLGTLAFFRRDPPRGQADGGGGVVRRANIHDYLGLLENRSYVLATLGMAAMTFAIGGISYWMSTYVSEVRKAGELGRVNLIFGIITVVSGILATLLGGYVADKLRKRFPGSYFWVSAAGMFIACPLTVLMLYTPFPAAWGVIFLIVFFLFFNTGPSNAILANVTHSSVRATAFALNILLIHALGDALSPPLLGAVADHSGWNAAFGLVVAVMALASVLWAFGAKYLAADTVAAERSPQQV